MMTQPEAQSNPHHLGVKKEERARQAYIAYRLRNPDAAARRRFFVEETGLCVWREEPWLAASPDGVVSHGDDVGALEIKCCSGPEQMRSVDQIDPRYFDQMQGHMAVLSSVLRRPVT